ncbi:MAG: GntR family transcriptional regulator [Bryobacterales bacterium]|nr:GntR family transcriptional regulator [Bryobacterales bacterium]
MARTTNKLQPVRTGTVKSQVVDALREAIFSGGVAPGEPLREAHLGASLGVSQATVREALLTLEQAGLVQRNNRETTVTKLSPGDIAERSRLRAVLEGMAGVDAAKRMDRAAFAELDRRLDTIHKALKRDSYMDFMAADLEFHRFVWRASGDQMLYQVLDLITLPMFAFLSIRRSRSLHHLSRTVRSHDPIVAALHSGDEHAIREAFRAHIEGSYKGFSQASDAAPAEGLKRRRYAGAG